MHPHRARASELTCISISTSRANRQHVTHHGRRESKEEDVDTEEHLVAGLDYEVAVVRRVQRGRGGIHVTSTGRKETAFAHLTFGVQYLYGDLVIGA